MSVSADKVWAEDHVRLAAMHEDWAQAAAGRYDDGNERSGLIAQVEMMSAQVHATLAVAERLERLCLIERSRS
jgi:hypothetical protein